jgi:hypothetical protein
MRSGVNVSVGREEKGSDGALVVFRKYVKGFME